MFENEIVRKAIILVVVCLIAYVLQRILTRATKHILERGNVPKGSIFTNLIRGLVWFLALLAVLEPVFGVQPTAFVAALAVLMVAVLLHYKKF